MSFDFLYDIGAELGLDNFSTDDLPSLPGGAIGGAITGLASELLDPLAKAGKKYIAKAFGLEEKTVDDIGEALGDFVSLDTIVENPLTAPFKIYNIYKDIKNVRDDLEIETKDHPEVLELLKGPASLFAERFSDKSTSETYALKEQYNDDVKPEISMSGIRAGASLVPNNIPSRTLPIRANKRFRTKHANEDLTRRSKQKLLDSEEERSYSKVPLSIGSRVAGSDLVKNAAVQQTAGGYLGDLNKPDQTYLRAVVYTS